MDRPLAIVHKVAITMAIVAITLTPTLFAAAKN